MSRRTARGKRRRHSTTQRDLKRRPVASNRTIAHNALHLDWTDLRRNEDDGPFDVSGDFCASLMKKYEKGAVLGEGTFGKVIRATHKETQEVVAIKTFRVGESKEGVHMTALREIKLLKELRHPRIVRLLDIFEHKKTLSLVFEYLESDLEAVIRDPSLILSPSDIKSYIQMCMESLVFIHSQGVFHRDIKPNNLLISKTGEIKLADFGLARIFAIPDVRFTPQVFSRWYRPPELLFNANAYGPTVDVWALGCVFAELMLRVPWMPGENDIDQLGKIFHIFGTPTDDDWPDHKSLPSYIPFRETRPTPLVSIFPQAPPGALDLLKKMMELNPNKRISAEDALQHDYFQLDPKPSLPVDLPRPRRREDAPLIRQ